MKHLRRPPPPPPPKDAATRVDWRPALCCTTARKDLWRLGRQRKDEVVGDSSYLDSVENAVAAAVGVGVAVGGAAVAPTAVVVVVAGIFGHDDNAVGPRDWTSVAAVVAGAVVAAAAAARWCRKRT